ncbi:MAG TPA: ABC transporter permease [Candidatus Methylomirabilis sp.]|nr:ABC transporter permease [Candidatus Methylomirabilis sp.]
MEWLRILAWRLRGAFGQRQRESELDTELRAHIEALAEENLRRGMSQQEARYAARREFGGVEQTKELYRDQRGLPFFETLLHDIRFGMRMLAKNPSFTIVAVCTLALGIGASAAIFSVVNAVLLRPLNYKDPDRLVTILHDIDNPVAVANYIDWRDQSQSFQAMAAAEYWTPNLIGIDPPEHLWGLQVTQNLLPMLGVQPLLGRLFAEGEDQKGAEFEVILGHGLWQRRFAGDPGIVGKTITLNGNSYTVVGVMPRDFKFAPFWATRAELWVPDAFGDRVNNRDGNSLRVFARLQPRVTLASARAEMATITARLEKQFPGTNRHVDVTPLKEMVVGDVQTPLLVLLGAVGFVLLIACSNVAHMLLARSATRQREIAVRAALGAPRGRLICQLFIENSLLGFLGAGAGVVLGLWGMRTLIAISPAIIPRMETVGLDGRVTLFLLGLTLFTILAFGVAPAVQMSSSNLTDALNENSRGSSDSVHRKRFRSFLVASEFALALILLVGAGLLIRSFFALRSVDAGFNPHNVLSMVVSVAGSKEADSSRRGLFYRNLLERVRALPGVVATGGINHLPLAGDLWGWPFKIEGRPKPRPGESPWGIYRIVTPGYFESMRLPLDRGRDISMADDSGAPGVVIINERAARLYWPGVNPIGQHISFDDKADPPTWLTVIGIVRNAKQGDWAATPDPEVYLAAFQNREFLGELGSHMAYITLVVRTDGNPSALASSVKNTVWSLDRDLPVSEVVTMDGVVSDANAQPRFEMLLLGVFALVALVMAAAGIYGVMNYSVSKRTREIGIRISLGARRPDVFRLVMRQGMVLALTGLSVGTVGAILLSRLMNKILYGVTPTDPVTFVSVAILLTAIALVANYVPARRAMRVDPVVALRYE